MPFDNLLNYSRRACAALALVCASQVPARDVTVSTHATQLIIRADEGRVPQFLYYGPALHGTERDAALATFTPQELYPAFGLDPMREKALAVRYADGDMCTVLAARGVDSCTEGDGATVTSVSTADDRHPLAVVLKYRTRPDDDIIEMWTEIANEGSEPVELLRYASACLPVRRGDVWLSHIYGAWADNGRLMQEPLTPGLKRIKNKDGVRNAETAHAEAMFSLDGRPDDRAGATIGAALCYSGNYALDIDTDDTDHHRFIAGINPDNSAVTLAPGETFVTPALAVTYSREGTGGVSRNFHRWVRRHNLHAGERLRPVLLNSWEGVYFDINEPAMVALMRDVRDLGGELFVMDDGWFGGKYPRDTDTTSLGDWTVNRAKLPHGVSALADSAHSVGVDFGIWIEPEMTNTVSELYEKHPEWVVGAPGRDPVAGRGGTQLVLDLSNPEVQDYIVGVFDRLMAEAPGIDYVKWDANCAILSYGSPMAGPDSRSSLYVDWHRGLNDVLRRIREHHPDVAMQLCASGGGRVNMGLLPYFDEVWTSDNTDAVQRVFMQWGTSYFYPAMVQGAHISAVPNHQTHRTIPLKYRADVAMSGRLGLELLLSRMSPAELAFTRRAVAQYKLIRPVVQTGDLYRLLSPYDRLGAAALMYVAEDKAEAVFYWWKLDNDKGACQLRVKMDGLDPDRLYTVTELNAVDGPAPYEGKAFTGRFLMDSGLEMAPYHSLTSDYYQDAANADASEYASHVLHLRAL